MFPVIFGVELGDYGETKDDLVFMFGMSVEPDKVVDNLPVGLTCVGLIDGRFMSLMSMIKESMYGVTFSK